MNKKLQFLKNHFEYKKITLKKGATLIQAGEICKKLYCIEKGLFKARYLTVKGDEYIKSFMPEDNLISPSSSYLSKNGSTYDVVALEPSSVFEFDMQIVFEQIEKNHSIAIFAAKIALELAAKKEAREYEFLCLSESEKWLNFPEDLKKRVQQKDIARYMGITDVALSRIKKKTTPGI